MNKKIKNTIFKDNKRNGDKKLKNLQGGNHPPKNKILFKDDIKIIFAYSPIKKKAKPTDEYSTLYPDTNSASASGKSKGWRLVSATEEIKNNKKIGKKGIINHISFCAKTIFVKFKDPTGNNTVIRIIPIETS